MQANGSRWERPDAPLGTLVFRAGLLSKEKLESALVEGRRTGKRLGEVLLAKGWIDEKDLARLLAGQKSLPFVSLRGRGFDPEAARLISEEVSRDHHAVAVEDTGVRVVVAVADPTDDDAMKLVQRELGRDVELVVSTPSEIREILDEVFSGQAASGPLRPLGDEFGLRLAAPGADEPAEEPADEPPTDEAPAPLEPLAPVELPLLHPTPVESEPEPAAEFEAEPEPEPEPEQEPAFDSEPEPALDSEPEFDSAPLVEPTIERNEETRVSLAFHQAPATPAVEEPQVEEPEVEEPHVEEPHVEEPVVEVPQVEEPAASVPDPVEDAEPETPDLPYRIVLCLDGGDEIDVAFFATEVEAQAAARELVAGIAQDKEWPQVGNKFFPPERIASVEVRERASFGGSRGRAEWGNS
jgi:Type II secretion system (T2SS), protein E, N-terminal domain